MDLFKAEKNNYESQKLFIKEIPFALLQSRSIHVQSF